MKKLLFLGLAMVLSFSACEKKQTRYTQQSPEIETVKQFIESYNAKNLDKNRSFFADTSKTYYNTKDNPMTPDEVVAYHKARLTVFSTRMFTNEEPEYEMVLTDDGETWVNCWLNWKGTLAANNQEYDMPVHLTYQFINGKIVKEVGMYDASEINLALQAIEATKNEAVKQAVISE